LREWQAADGTQQSHARSAVPGPPSIATLFDEWSKEDTKISDAAAAEDDELWAESTAVYHPSPPDPSH
jgi:hypothetical protein